MSDNIEQFLRENALSPTTQAAERAQHLDRVLAQLDKEADELFAIMQRAVRKLDDLPLSVQEPFRSNAMGSLIAWGSHAMAGAHDAGRCENCFGLALEIATASLGWADFKAERPAEPSERLKALTDQIDLALAYLDAKFGSSRPH